MQYLTFGVFPRSRQVIRRLQGLDEVLPRLDPHSAARHFASIQRWKAKREVACPRKGTTLSLVDTKSAKNMHTDVAPHFGRPYCSGAVIGTESILAERKTPRMT